MVKNNKFKKAYFFISCYFILLFLFYRFTTTENMISQSIFSLFNFNFISSYKTVQMNYGGKNNRIDEIFFGINDSWSNDFFQSLVTDIQYNMFFFETKIDNKYLTERQLCSIESAAKNNPNAIVNLYSINAKIHPVFLKKYPNIKIHKLIIEDLLKDTPLEKWYKLKKEVVLNGPYAVVHTADILRIVALWKYGGYYADFDTLTVRSIESLLKYPGVGYLFEAGKDSMNNAVMNFPKQHPFLSAAINNIKKDYQVYSWGHQGPLLMIRTFKKHCKTSNIYKELKFDKNELEYDAIQFKGKRRKYSCDAHILENNFFNPHTIGLNNQLFEANYSMSIKNFIDVFTIHLFNTKSKYSQIKRNSFYEYIARIHCPLAYKVILKYGL